MERTYRKDLTPTHGYAATREAAMTAFAKSLAAGVKRSSKKAPHKRGSSGFEERRTVRFNGNDPSRVAAAAL
jgi:hypothetical protein